MKSKANGFDITPLMIPKEMCPIGSSSCSSHEPSIPKTVRVKHQLVIHSDCDSHQDDIADIYPRQKLMRLCLPSTSTAMVECTLMRGKIPVAASQACVKNRWFYTIEKR